jgi:hypothetical protein
MSTRTSVFFLLLTSCGIENQVEGGLPDPPVVNPPELENPTQTDIIIQTTTPEVDVLWVIDNSCSMSCVVGCHGLITDSVVENFHLFMDYFLGSGLDYHLGVVTTDTDDNSQAGKLQYGRGYKYIDVDTVDPIGVFSEMATQGTDGSGQERGLGATFLAIDEVADTFNAGFYRSDASLHTVVLSNEPDMTQSTVITQSEFVEWYDGLKDEADERTFNAIVCIASNSEECPQTSIGTDYINTTHEIGGIVWDIARDDWADLLDQLGAQAAGLKREYFLSQLPVPETVEVRVEDPTGVTFYFAEAIGDPPIGDYTYDPSRNSITFLEFVPESLSKVIISYTILSSLNTGITESDTEAVQ